MRKHLWLLVLLIMIFLGISIWRINFQVKVKSTGQWIFQNGISVATDQEEILYTDVIIGSEFLKFKNPFEYSVNTKIAIRSPGLPGNTVQHQIMSSDRKGHQLYFKMDVQNIGFEEHRNIQISANSRIFDNQGDLQDAEAYSFLNIPTEGDQRVTISMIYKGSDRFNFRISYGELETVVDAGIRPDGSLWLVSPEMPVYTSDRVWEVFPDEMNNRIIVKNTGLSMKRKESKKQPLGE